MDIGSRWKAGKGHVGLDGQKAELREPVAGSPAASRKPVNDVPAEIYSRALRQPHCKQGVDRRLADVCQRRKRAVTGPKSRQRKALYRRNRLESHCCPLRPAICGNVRLTLHAIKTLSRAIRVMVLTIVDTFTRFSPGVDRRFSYKGEDVVATLERICRSIGYPESIRVDQGSEFISRDLDLWAYQKGAVLDFSRPGKPTDNGFIVDIVT